MGAWPRNRGMAGGNPEYGDIGGVLGDFTRREEGLVRKLTKPLGGERVRLCSKNRNYQRLRGHRTMEKTIHR